MNSISRRRVALRISCLAAATLALASGVTPAFAQQWPEASRPVRIVVGFPPGGGADALARAIAQPLAKELAGTVIVENRPGAGGLTATEQVARATPDGYTLYIATPGSFTIWPTLRKLNYDPAKDFVFVSNLVTMPNLLVTTANSPYKDVAGLLAAARAPGANINYGSGGVGTIGQIAAEQLNELAHVQLKHVPYKGTAPLITDVVGGVVPITFSDPSAKSLVDGGKLRLLAVTSAKRSRLFPNTPTMAESGVPGYDLSNWYGLVAPEGTPPEVVNKLNAAIRKVMVQPEVRQSLEAAGMEAISTTPKEFGDHVAGERRKWAALIAKAGIKAE
ncbi:tripartite tricarboxylate transporter substrate binding protein [Ramlibacter sp. PS3R-8]|uniref:Bug family tripartite tricarboxylate transporter substrate binding protein n=1 Tax=Ramlibacter sp. PS3R-8 TaxID=3133437 RepID=UPI0030A6A7E2